MRGAESKGQRLERNGYSRTVSFSRLPFAFSRFAPSLRTRLATFVGKSCQNASGCWNSRQSDVPRSSSLTFSPFRTPSGIVMSPYLPPEILDLIVDNLNHEPHTLGVCCLVSKEWIYRTRRHLFNRVTFGQSRRVSQWGETFGDPLNSPAHHTRILSIGLTSLITDTDMHTLNTFCGVTHLSVDTTCHYDQTLSLVPLHGFSPAIRSLNLTLTTLPSSEIFNLVCSLPFLEDLSLAGRPRKWDEAWKVPSTSPRLCGSLKLHRAGGIQSIISRLLDLPTGLRFKKISVEWISPGDVGSTMDLISKCSDTLESLEITGNLAG